jgi:hypothetical protein
MEKWITLALSLVLFTGCIQQSVPEYRPVHTVPKVQPKPAEPTPPKIQHTLKKVEDTNFSPDYMYPETGTKQSVKKKDNTMETVTTQMSKEECIGMIGQEKFDRYTQMLGSEAGAIKRCVLLKSMQ